MVYPVIVSRQTFETPFRSLFRSIHGWGEIIVCESSFTISLRKKLTIASKNEAHFLKLDRTMKNCNLKYFLFMPPKMEAVEISKKSQTF